MNEYINDMLPSREFYQNLKNENWDTAEKFLENILAYCSLMNIGYYRKQEIIAMIMHVLPLPGEKFTSCIDINENEVNFLKKHGLVK